MPNAFPGGFCQFRAICGAVGATSCKGNAGTRCEPPRHLAVTWEFAGEVSWLSVALSEVSLGQPMLELAHLAHVDDERWDRYGPGAVGVGWDMALMGLGQHLATGASVDPNQAMAWLGSDAGRQFVSGSSEDWCRASVASGTDAAKAKVSAARTTAIYTGQPEPPKED